jgi:3-deoxy-7-phosphoheptulonate synthase
MIIVMRTEAQQEEIDAVRKAVADEGLETYVMVGAERIVMGVVGTGVERVRHVEGMPGVEQLIRVSKPYKLASSEHHPDRSAVHVGGVAIGGGAPLAVVAGPCAVESREQLLATARWVKREGANLLRGGAFKPRSSPYSFQGLGEEGLRLLRGAADQHGLALVSEVMDISQIDVVTRHADILQVGARNMQNFTLLRELGRTRKPVLLKRGISATIEEWLLSAEYVLAGGNTEVILCERGIRTFESYTRNTLDISAIPVVKKLSHLPVFVDPSHGTGRRDKVAPMARAAVAAGADGLLIEVHCDPDRALSDGAQSLYPGQFDRLMAELRIIAPAIGRSICLEPVSRRGWGV